ncbi:MAG TPA: HAMP domain-containing sensor histidine kinase [Solirubrobacteraceae bacterium]|nr:HAMP domain-containing sensor histidine kinase [Solirubrobacteraceae bacterium]
MSLLGRVFAANTAVFATAVALLAWTPVTVHRIATPRELLVLVIGLILMLAVDLWLLRRTFGPLRRLAATMGAVDPARPGRRADSFDDGGEEVAALAGALNAMLDRLEAERQESGLRVLAAQEQERARIARELHDEVGQTLTAIALRAERAAAATGSQQQALNEIADTALRSLEDVRRIGRELRPEALDDLGLINALIALCARMDRQGGPRIRRDLDWHLPDLSPEAELVIYRAAQEALTNVLRHAQASAASVSLSHRTSEVELRVIDDGRGLPSNLVENGLRGMRERAMVIDATLHIGPSSSGGTEVVLRVPV